MNNLHIVICSNLAKSNGGCEIWLDYFVKRLLPLRLYGKVFVYHVIAAQKRAEELSEQGIISIACPRYSNGIGQVLRFSFKSIWHLMKNERAGDEVVLIGSTFVSFVGIALWIYRTVLFKNIKIITWIRSIAVQELSVRSPYIAKVAGVFEYVLLGMSDKVIMNGHDTYAFYADKYHLRGKAFTVENAVPNDELFSVCPISEEKVYIDIAYTGRYSSAKGFEIYLESVKRFVANNPVSNIRFHCYGHGPLADLIDVDLVVDHGKYTPEKIIAILEQTDIVVFFNKSGIAAGVSHSLLETMAAARGIIAWDNKIHNQVCDEKMAYLVPENDIDNLVKIYEDICNNRQNLVKKAVAARRCAEGYSILNHIRKFIGIVRE